MAFAFWPLPCLSAFPSRCYMVHCSRKTTRRVIWRGTQLQKLHG